MKRKRLVAGVAALALCLGGAAPAFAAPDFGGDLVGLAVVAIRGR